MKVKFTLVPTDVYASKLKNAIQSGNAPDVFAIEEAFVRSFVEEPGVMADLEDLKPDLEEMEILDYTLDVGTDFDGIYVLFPGRQRRAPCFTGEV